MRTILTRADLQAANLKLDSGKAPASVFAAIDDLRTTEDLEAFLLWADDQGYLKS